MRNTILNTGRHVYVSVDQAIKLADYGSRRYHPFAFSFDSSASLLDDPNPNWDEEIIKNHIENKENYISTLKDRYGTSNIDKIIENIKYLGVKPFSLISYHNKFLEQSRQAFILGLEYPSLVSSCALGERMLNHLIIDLREFYRKSENYRKIFNKESFDNWELAISVLDSWGVLLDGVKELFLRLKIIRHKSIHFNMDTYTYLRNDAIEALQILNGIISKQFGLFGNQPWFVDDTPGAQFVKRGYERNPFVSTYIIPKAGFVGPLYGMDLTEGGWIHLDYVDYGDVSLSDDEFAKAYRERNSSVVASRALINAQTAD